MIIFASFCQFEFLCREPLQRLLTYRNLSRIFEPCSPGHCASEGQHWCIAPTHFLKDQGSRLACYAPVLLHSHTHRLNCYPRKTIHLISGYQERQEDRATDKKKRVSNKPQDKTESLYLLHGSASTTTPVEDIQLLPTLTKKRNHEQINLIQGGALAKNIRKDVLTNRPSNKSNHLHCKASSEQAFVGKQTHLDEFSHRLCFFGPWEQLCITI